MRKLFLLPALLFAVLLAFGCQQSSTNDIVGAKVGNLASDFTLQDMEGNTVSLSDFNGSPVILNFWATWCRPCRHEMPFLQQIYDEWLDQGLVLLAINLGETPSEVNQFMQDNDLFFPTVLDTDGSVSLEYEVTGIPITFFIDKNGIIQMKRLGSFSSAAEIENYLAKIIP